MFMVGIRIVCVCVIPKMLDISYVATTKPKQTTQQKKKVKNNKNNVQLTNEAAFTHSNSCLYSAASACGRFL